MDQQAPGRRTALWRAVAVLALAGIVGGIMAAGPATAAKFLTKKKAFKLFYKKADADARFLNVGEGIESKVIYRKGPLGTLAAPNGTSDYFEADCPAGAKAVGGGVYTENDDVYVETSYPSSGNDSDTTGFTAWTTWVINYSGSESDITPYAVCLNAANVDANFASGGEPQRHAG
jgi:hypothetical protein